MRRMVPKLRKGEKEVKATEIKSEIKVKIQEKFGSISELAKAMGVMRLTISLAINGQSKPCQSLSDKIAKALDIVSEDFAQMLEVIRHEV